VVASILVVISMGVLTWKGATATESLASENIKKVPSWIKKNKLPPAAIPGAKLFAQVGCLNCHSYLGTGGGYAGAPDLSAEGSKGKGIKFQIDHLKCPSCVNPGSPMPQFSALGDARLKQLAIFLEASKGGK
jgi:mono/diheme cytochrome c family protein